jgi:hypothetical protein
MNRARWDWDTLQELVVDADYNKEWLWPMDYGRLLADAVKKRHHAGLSRNPSPKGTKFSLEGI